MPSTARLVLYSELLLVALIIGSINLLFPSEPGFLHVALNPYLLFCLLVAAYYGRYPGFAAIAFCVLVLLLPLPWILALSHPAEGAARTARDAILSGGLVPFAGAIVGAYLFGLIRDSNRQVLDRTRGRLRNTIRERVRLEIRTDALETVTRELEERVLRQRDALTTLYDQVQELYSYNLERTLDAVLETVERFSGATSASIWRYHPEARELRLASRRGPEVHARPVSTLPVEGSIEGWVIRNDKMFTVKMLIQYGNLKELDQRRNIITLPIRAGRRNWGVLSVEAMPFERYNPYTERLLQMILALVAPAMEKAVEYESTLAASEIDVHTGLPSFSQFHSSLERDLFRAQTETGSLSVIIVEIVNGTDIRAEHGDERWYQLSNRIIDALHKLSGSSAELFQYREDNQIAVLHPNLDFDGASLFCLELLSTITSTEWVIDERTLSVDAVVGYSAFGQGAQTVDLLLENAERLLEMQKV